MRRLASIAALLSALAVSTDAIAQGPSQPKLVCERGPVATKSFGGTSWQIYGCNDNRSGAIVTAPGSPASPSYVLWTGVKGVYTLTATTSTPPPHTAKPYAPPH